MKVNYKAHEVKGAQNGVVVYSGEDEYRWNAKTGKWEDVGDVNHFSVSPYDMSRRLQKGHVTANPLKANYYMDAGYSKENVVSKLKSAAKEAKKRGYTEGIIEVTNPVTKQKEEFAAPRDRYQAHSIQRYFEEQIVHHNLQIEARNNEMLQNAAKWNVPEGYAYDPITNSFVKMDREQIKKRVENYFAETLWGVKLSRTNAWQKRVLEGSAEKGIIKKWVDEIMAAGADKYIAPGEAPVVKGAIGIPQRWDDKKLYENQLKFLNSGLAPFIPSVKKKWKGAQIVRVNPKTLKIVEENGTVHMLVKDQNVLVEMTPTAKIPDDWQNLYTPLQPKTNEKNPLFFALPKPEPSVLDKLQTQTEHYQKEAAKWKKGKMWGEGVFKWFYAPQATVQEIGNKFAEFGVAVNKGISEAEDFFHIDLPFIGTLHSAKEKQKSAQLEKKLKAVDKMLSAKALYESRKNYATFWNFKESPLTRAKAIAFTPVGALATAPLVAETGALGAAGQVKTFIEGGAAFTTIEETGKTLTIPGYTPFSDKNAVGIEFVAGGLSTVAMEGIGTKLQKLLKVTPHGVGPKNVLKRVGAAAMTGYAGGATYSTSKQILGKEEPNVFAVNEQGLMFAAFGAGLESASVVADVGKATVETVPRVGKLTLKKIEQIGEKRGYIEKKPFRELYINEPENKIIAREGEIIELKLKGKTIGKITKAQLTEREGVVWVHAKPVDEEKLITTEQLGRETGVYTSLKRTVWAKKGDVIATYKDLFSPREIKNSYIDVKIGGFEKSFTTKKVIKNMAQSEGVILYKPKEDIAVSIGKKGTIKTKGISKAVEEPFNKYIFSSEPKGFVLTGEGGVKILKSPSAFLGYSEEMGVSVMEKNGNIIVKGMKTNSKGLVGVYKIGGGDSERFFTSYAPLSNSYISAEKINGKLEKLVGKTISEERYVKATTDAWAKKGPGIVGGVGIEKPGRLFEVKIVGKPVPEIELSTVVRANTPTTTMGGQGEFLRETELMKMKQQTAMQIPKEKLVGAIETVGIVKEGGARIGRVSLELTATKTSLENLSKLIPLSLAAPRKQATEAQQKNAELPKYILSLSVATKTKQAPKTIEKTVLKLKPVEKTILSTIPYMPNKLAPSYSLISSTSTASSTTFITPSPPTSPTPFIPTLPPPSPTGLPPEEPVIAPPVPLPKLLPSGVFRRRRKTPSARKSNKYRPSLGAVVLDIRAPSTPKLVTGFGIRPIVESAGSRRRKSKSSSKKKKKKGGRR